MSKQRITVEDLWKLERIGAPKLSPDGAQAVASVTRYDMDANKSSSSLWLFSTFGGDPRKLTACGEKDGEAAWSPRGDLVAFVAKREQEGKKDDSAQLYVIAPDGGEARRVTDYAPGVFGIKWFPDGKRIAFLSWVWPQEKGDKAQAKAHKAFKDRKETAYVTEEHWYRYWDHNLPMGRAIHLHVVDIATGKVTDLFEGSALELGRADASAADYDISPDGKHIVFSHDPLPVKRILNTFALSRIDVKTRKVSLLVQDKDWDFRHPVHAADGKQLAVVVAHSGKRHTAPALLGMVDAASGRWQALSAKWDREVVGVPAWSTEGDALYCMAEDLGRCHLWRFDLKTRTPKVLVQGGWVHGFSVSAGQLVYTADSMIHPDRLHVLDAEGTPKRLERFNDDLIKAFKFGPYESVSYKGAKIDGKRTDAQMWVIYPPGFDAKKKYPLLHSIHGGPHTASGDTFHYRWNNQVFASGNGTQDYVVVCVNYHGSTSFGFDYKDSITHRWGELELQDVEAATDHMLTKPYIDANRVYATGGSYGGYMVAWMNGHCKPGRYQAYVCHAGCYDWVSMFASDGAEWFKKELGAWYWDDMAKVHKQSPHAFARHFSTPTLVIHGQLDYRVPDAQGLAYYSTLKAQEIDARLVWFPDENHWILKPRNSKLWYAEFFDWLKRYPSKSTVKPPARKKGGGAK
jgi:dipeptidyl aminopeptidase/acylaminoacyl peptidase